MMTEQVSDDGGLPPIREQTDFPVFSPPDFLDRLIAARSARDPGFPAMLAAAKARLVAERVPLRTEQQLMSRDQLVCTIDGLEDELNLSAQAAREDAIACGKKQIEDAKRIRVLEACCERWEARAQVGLGAFAEASIDAAKAIESLTNQRDHFRVALDNLDEDYAELEKAQSKALLRRRMMLQELDDLDEYCELLEKFASKKACRKAQRKFDKRRKMIPNREVFAGLPPLVPNDDADRAENEKHNREYWEGLSNG